MIKGFKQHFASLSTKLQADERGAAALTVFLIVLAVSIIVVSTTALIGVDNLTIGFSQQTSSELVLSAESCAEEALLRLSRENTYAGGTVTIGDGQCDITVAGTPCGNCTIDVEATEKNFTRRIQVTASVVDSTIDILTWKEIE